MRNANLLRSSSELARGTMLLALALLLVSSIATPAAWSQSPPTINDLFSEINARIPGFGGLYVDPDKDTLYVQIVPGYSTGAAELNQAISDILGPDRPPESKLVMLDAQYSFVELRSWHDYSDETIMPIDGVVSTGIDHQSNRVFIGVENQQAEAAVRARLADLGIPLHAVEIMHEESPVDTSNKECTSLLSFCRPIVGGLQIHADKDPEDTFSSLGFNATRKGTPGFVTCSHCANERFKNTGTIYAQNKKNNKDVAKEMANPELTQKLGAGKACPEKSICRLGDTSFAEYTGGPDTSPGLIARPAESKTDWNGNDYFKITGYTKSVEGQYIAKVGITTGFTQGKVAKAGVCRNLKRAMIKGLTLEPELICVNVADYIAANGDSGGPVFLCTDTKNKCTDSKSFEVHLLGIHFAGPSTAVPGERFYSDFGLAMDPTSELGPLTKFCVPDAKNERCP